MKRLVLLLIVVLAFMVMPAKAEITITLTEPADGTYIAECGSMTISAELDNPDDESIRDVSFIYGSSFGGRLRREPWTVQVENMVTGNYDVYARVRKSDGTSVYSDTVKVKCGPISNGEVVSNGGFSCGESDGWVLQTHENAQASVEIFDDYYFEDPYYAFFEITDGSTERWHIQYSVTCPVDSGHRYEISFWADADDTKEIDIGMQENQDPWATQMWETVTIDGWDIYGPYEAFAQWDDPNNQFRFNVGGNTTNFYFDKLQVIDRSATGVAERIIGADGTMLSSYELHKAYPNPFNMETTIRYELSKQADIQLDIFNTNGQFVRSLDSGQKSIGLHRAQWNGTDTQNQVVPSGVYFYRLIINDGAQQRVLSQKMMLLK